MRIWDDECVKWMGMAHKRDSVSKLNALKTETLQAWFESTL